MGRPQLAEVEKNAFRESVAKEALNLLDEEGASNLTLRRLAARLGCSYAKPYRYFRDKADVIDAARERAFNRFADHAERSAADGPLSGASYIEFVVENREAYRVMFEMEQEYVSAETRAAEDRAWRAWSRQIHEMVARLELPGDPETIAHIVWAALHGLASLHLADKLSHGRSLEDVLGGLAAALGFAPEGKGA